MNGRGGVNSPIPHKSLRCLAVDRLNRFSHGLGRLSICFRFVSPPFCVPNVGRRWAMSACSGVSIWVGHENRDSRWNRVPTFFRTANVISTCRRPFAFPMSADVGPCRQWSELRMAENVEVAAEIASPSLSVKKYFYTSSLCRRYFAFSMSADVGPCRQCYGWVGHHLKHWGSRWNHVDILSNSQKLFL